MVTVLITRYVVACMTMAKAIAIARLCTRFRVYYQASVCVSSRLSAFYRGQDGIAGTVAGP